MPKRVLDVGNCDPDHASIRRMIEGRFEAAVDRAEKLDDALVALRSRAYDLVLVNRKLDIDYSDGLAVIQAIKADAALAATPCMLVTNHAEHQQTAVAAGAEPGFGKDQLDDEETLRRLSQFLAEC